MQTTNLSFGEKAVGLHHNPSNNPTAAQIKKLAAELIDELHELRNDNPQSETYRMASIAITEIQTGVMWGVKAATWDDEQ